MSTKKSSAEPKTMAELLAHAKSKVQQFTKGQRVNALVLSKSPTAIIFDIGGKSEGIVKEKAYTDAREFIETIKVGDDVLATVLVPETRDGITILALKDAMRRGMINAAYVVQKIGAQAGLLKKDELEFASMTGDD